MKKLLTILFIVAIGCQKEDMPIKSVENTANNTAIGCSCTESWSTGQANISMGYRALMETTTGTKSGVFGITALGDVTRIIK